MNYLLKKTISNAFILSDITGKKVDDILNCLFSFYACSKQEIKQIKDVCSNNIFMELEDPSLINIYINYINSFCNEEKSFGKNGFEKEILSIKKDVYIFMDSLCSNGYKNFGEYLSTHYAENDSFGVLYALLLLVTGQDKDSYIPLLKRIQIKKAAEETEAGIILLNLCSNEEKKQIFKGLTQSKELRYQVGILKQLADFHHLDYEFQKGDNQKCKTEN